MGLRVHSTLEKLYKDLHHTKLNSLAEMLEFFEEDWEKNWNPDIVINKPGLNQMHYFNLGKKCVSDYYKKFAPFDQGKCIGIEKRIIIDLDKTGRYKLQGYIDRLDDVGNGVYEIHDYKTSARLPEQKELDKDRQLALYSLAVKEMLPDAKTVNLVWHYVAFDKTVSSQRTEQDLEKLKKKLIAVINRIEREKKYLPIKTGLCAYCQYQDLCPDWKHPKKVGKLAPKSFKADDGVRLVNRYVKVYNEKKQLVEKLEKELDAIKEDIFSFAKQHRINVIQGSDAKLRVKIGEKFRFPGSGTEAREALDSLVIDEGKWMEVSSLNVSALTKALEAQEWPSELIKKLKKYADTEQEQRIYLGKV